VNIRRIPLQFSNVPLELTNKLGIHLTQVTPRYSGARLTQEKTAVAYTGQSEASIGLQKPRKSEELFFASIPLPDTAEAPHGPRGVLQAISLKNPRPPIHKALSLPE
jgi:hypothetical protein